MWRIPMTFEILWLLVQARSIRSSRARNGVSLPLVSTSRELNLQTAARIVILFDGILSVLMRQNKHICFYRSYGLATVLRKRGLPVVMNVGGRGLGINEAQKAHCWLTLDERLFHEKENALQLYPFDMGYNQTRSIRYWIGPELNEAIMDENRITRARSIQPLFNRFKDHGKYKG